MERYDEIFIPIHDLNDDWTIYVNTDPEHRQLHHFVQFKMFERENETLWDIYSAFNEKLETLIDRYENEELPAGKVDAAIAIAENFRNKKTGELEKAAFEKLMQALHKAKEMGKPVYFWF